MTYQANTKKWNDTKKKEEEKKSQLIKKINEYKSAISKGWQQKRKMEGEKDAQLTQSDKQFRVRGLRFEYQPFCSLFFLILILSGTTRVINDSHPSSTHSAGSGSSLNQSTMSAAAGSLSGEGFLKGGFQPRAGDFTSIGGTVCVSCSFLSHV